jgi:hypothetical protein
VRAVVKPRYAFTGYGKAIYGKPGYGYPGYGGTVYGKPRTIKY